jgi:hypothetical protein
LVDNIAQFRERAVPQQRTVYDEDDGLAVGCNHSRIAAKSWPLSWAQTIRKDDKEDDKIDCAVVGPANQPPETELVEKTRCL